MRVVYDKEGVDPCSGDAHYRIGVHQRRRRPKGRLHNRTGEDNADAHLKRQVMGREVVVAVTNGRIDGFAWLAEIFGKWERIFQARQNGWHVSLDGRRRKRVLVKIIGE